MTRRRAEQGLRRGQRDLPGQVEVQIDELVLHGFAHADRYAIARSLESELVRLLSERGVPPVFRQGAEIRSLDGGNITLPPGARPDSTGRQVAREIYARMRR